MQWDEKSSGKMREGQLSSNFIIGYLILANLYISFRYLKLAKLFGELTVKSDGYYEAWKNGSSVILREKKVR
jgi:hypothetical protein